MAIVTLEGLIDEIEARLLDRVTDIRFLDRLDSPREFPKNAAHRGVRVWPASTDIIDQYVQTDLVRVEDEIVVESTHKVTRNADASLDGALAFERSIREALTNPQWYSDRDAAPTTPDRIEVHVGPVTREKAEGWLLIEQTFTVQRDASLGGI